MGAGAKILKNGGIKKWANIFWNAGMVFIGCSAFEVNGWEHETNDINEAIKFYKEKWGYCWAEDKKGNVFYKI